MNLKTIIEGLLKEDQRCQDDNNWLIIQTLKKLGFNLWISYDDLPKMPPFDSIVRTKRRIQNKENKYNEELIEEGVTFEKPNI